MEWVCDLLWNLSINPKWNCFIDIEIENILEKYESSQPQKNSQENSAPLESEILPPRDIIIPFDPSKAIEKTPPKQIENNKKNEAAGQNQMNIQANTFQVTTKGQALLDLKSLEIWVNEVQGIIGNNNYQFPNQA